MRFGAMGVCFRAMGPRGTPVCFGAVGRAESARRHGLCVDGALFSLHRAVVLQPCMAMHIGILDAYREVESAIVYMRLHAVQRFDAVHVVIRSSYLGMGLMIVNSS